MCTCSHSFCPVSPTSDFSPTRGNQQSAACLSIRSPPFSKAPVRAISDLGLHQSKGVAGSPNAAFDLAASRQGVRSGAHAVKVAWPPSNQEKEESDLTGSCRRSDSTFEEWWQSCATDGRVRRPAVSWMYRCLRDASVVSLASAARRRRGATGGSAHTPTKLSSLANRIPLYPRRPVCSTSPPPSTESQRRAPLESVEFSYRSTAVLFAPDAMFGTASLVPAVPTP